MDSAEAARALERDVVVAVGSDDPHAFGFFFTVGYDWKVGCRIHRCERPDGVPCCYQACADGGDSGLAYEPGDAHACMNASTGSRKYQWYLNGLIESGVVDAAGCE